MDLRILAHAFSPRFLPLWFFVPPALYVQLRGKVRLPFVGQLFSHTTLLAPYNALVTLLSAVPRTPFVDAAHFPELAVLRENWELVRDEALELWERGFIRDSEAYDDAGFNSFFRRGWKRFYLKWYGEPPASARELCPRTLALIEGLPRVRAAMFVRMAGKSRLPTHRDPFAGSLRYHLGLRVPREPGCKLWVDGTEYSWRDGEAVLFDETFVHWARNDTDEDRFILFCDVERPLKSRVLERVNRWVGDRVMRLARTKNVDGEEVGAVNKLFGIVYPIRVAGKKLKRLDRRLYYGLKYALVLCALYLIFR